MLCHRGTQDLEPELFPKWGLLGIAAIQLFSTHIATYPGILDWKEVLGVQRTPRTCVESVAMDPSAGKQV